MRTLRYFNKCTCFNNFYTCYNKKMHNLYLLNFKNFNKNLLLKKKLLIKLIDKIKKFKNI